MSAYHNDDWAECYDLWVDLLFGTGPSEDIPVFETILKQTLADTTRSTLKIVDLGTGSGRVPIYLQRCVREKSLHLYMNNAAAIPVSFEILGLEPSIAMLNRAKRFWNAEMERHRNANLPRFTDHWVQCGASDFASKIQPIAEEVDLVIFAAGGITHLTKDEEVFSFLKNVAQVLSSSGKAVVSVLHDTLPEDFRQEVDTVSPEGAKPQRIPSVDRPGEVYVKYGTTSEWHDDIKTEKFHLDVEDEGGKVLRSHDLEWDMKLFHKETFEKFVTEAELKMSKVIEGQIQFWYLLEKA